MNIPKAPGIYKSNGQYYQTKNLQKKAKKLKDFEVIEVLDTNDCSELDQALNKYKGFKHPEQQEDKVILHHYHNPETNYSMVSIYDNLESEGYVQID